MLARSAVVRPAVLLVLLAALAAGSLAVTPQPVSAAAPWVVKVVGDAPDANPGNGICATSGGNCTLRAAIQEANKNPGPDTIEFFIPKGGTKIITLASKLPMLKDAETTIDGYTQPGASVNTAPRASNAQLRIEIRSASTNVGWAAMKIASPDNVIRGIAMHRNWRSIELVGDNADRNAIVGMFIGTNAAGTYASTAWNHANGGVFIGGGAQDNDIGLPNLADRNVISGNPASGVYFSGTSGSGAGASSNRVRNNIVGLSPNGSKRLANRLEGIDLNTGATDNVIGGTAQYEHNVVSGNHADGIEFSHGISVQRNHAVGNYVGTNLEGTRGPDYARNGYRTGFGSGIKVEDGVRDTVIEDNVVGNAGYALIHISGLPISDGGQGITRGTVVRNNRIGVSLDGTPIPVRSGGCCGIRIDLVADTSTIGPGNVIRNNPRGIAIFAAKDDQHTITRNAIYGNTGLGIDLQAVGRVTVNDFGDGDTGANQQRNYPALTSATLSTVTGSACVGCTVEVFLAAGGAGAYGEGRRYLASDVAGLNGRFSADVSGTGLAVGDFVTATATDANGNTSEFSLDLRVRMKDVPPPSTVHANDGFGRTSSGGWGKAATGGFWTNNANASDFRVTSGEARVNVGRGASRSAALLSVSALDVIVRARIRTDHLANGASQYAWLTARQTSIGDAYRLRVRLGTNGGVYLVAVRVVDGVQTVLGAEKQVTSIQHNANGWITVKAQVVTDGADTDIRMKAWAAGASEPSGWSYTRTDSSTALTLPGAVGVGANLPGASNPGPVRFSFDDVKATVSAP